MKRYFLFEYDDYYPGGGMNDFVGDFDTIEEALSRYTVKPDGRYSRWFKGDYEVGNIQLWDSRWRKEIENLHLLIK